MGLRSRGRDVLIVEVMVVDGIADLEAIEEVVEEIVDLEEIEEAVDAIVGLGVIEVVVDGVVDSVIEEDLVGIEEDVSERVLDGNSIFHQPSFTTSARSKRQFGETSIRKTLCPV